jgi:hypothetical protein
MARPGRLPLRRRLSPHQQRHLHPQPVQQARGRAACCSASSSVGAMRAAWYPDSAARSMASSATTVLPEPTSPWSSRFIRRSRGHVAEDLADRPLLGAGQLEREPVVEGADEGVGPAERDPAPLPGGQAVGPGVQELEEEELAVGQATAGPLRGGDGRGPVQRLQRLGQGRQAEAGQVVAGNGSWSASRGSRRSRFWSRMARSIRWDSPSVAGRWAGPGPLPRAGHPGPGPRAPGAGSGGRGRSGRARDQEAVALADGAVQERLPGPGALDEARVIPDHGLEDPEPLPGGQHALAHHLAEDRGVHPHLQGPDGATVLASS